MTYIVSHIDQAMCSEGYGIKQNDVNEQEGSDLEHTLNNIGEEIFTTSASLHIRSDWPYYWIYFTNWSWTLICLSFWIDTTLVVLRYRKEKKHLHHVVSESKTTSSDKGIHFKLKDTNIWI